MNVFSKRSERDLVFAIAPERRASSSWIGESQMKLVARSLLAVSLVLTGCAKKDDVVVESSDRVHVTDADIDKDPVALLPGGAVGITRVDVPQVFRSQFGPRLLSVVNARIPLPPSAGFDPQRDLSALYIGVYSMEGANSAGVAVGTFNPSAIDAAADGTTMTPLGAPLVKTNYTGRTIYVSRNVGFAVLTANTVVFGDETGIRRVLDRVSEGRAQHDLPAWIDSVLTTPNAALALAFDFTGQAPVQSLVKTLPFLSGVKTARALGNFEAPGMNFVGSLTYPDAQTAQTAAASILNINQMVSSYGFLMSLAGIGNPIQKLDATAVGSDAQFALSLQANAVQWALGQLIDRLSATQTAVPAQSSTQSLQSGSQP
jgi:hypothetical protein